MIINLDMKNMETGNFISICLENNLFTPLIYICNRVDDDFITPLNKIFSHTFVKKIIKVIEDLNEKKDLGYKCLWYIRMCFKGVMFPND